MAKAATQNKSKKKTALQAESRFYVINTVQQTRRNVRGRLEEYNQKLIVEPLKSGKKLACDLKKQPRKTVAALLDDSKEYISDLNKETRGKVNGILKEGRTLLAKAQKNPRKTFSGMIDDGKELVEELQNETRDKFTEVMDDYKSVINGIGRDTRLVMNEVVDGGKKALDKLPGKKKLEKAVSSRIQEIPGLLNLPSQKDVDTLARRVKKLNSKVEDLNKALAA